jgi:hypothetical protein
MNPSVSIHPLANKEYLDAVIYYRDLDSTAAAGFIDAYEHAVTEICRNPGASPIILAGIRRKLLRRFPYNIRITAVSHQLRMPFYWADRR